MGLVGSDLWLPGARRTAREKMKGKSDRRQKRGEEERGDIIETGSLLERVPGKAVKSQQEGERDDFINTIIWSYCT